MDRQSIEKELESGDSQGSRYDVSRIHRGEVSVEEVEGIMQSLSEKYISEALDNQEKIIFLEDPATYVVLAESGNSLSSGNYFFLKNFASEKCVVQPMVCLYQYRNSREGIFVQEYLKKWNQKLDNLNNDDKECKYHPESDIAERFRINRWG